MKGVFGGNFDPVHLGHIIIACEAVRILELEEIFFIPAWISPFKKDVKSSSFEHRFNMLKIATEGIEEFKVLDIEARIKGVSYTYNTLLELMKIEDALCLLIGDDQAEEFKDWFKWKEILDMVSVYVFRRSREPSEFPGELIPLDSRVIEISSTEIRDLIKKGESVNYLLPEGVGNYIVKYGLYT